MNGQEDSSMVPLYPDHKTGLTGAGGGGGGASTTGADNHQHHNNQYHYSPPGAPLYAPQHQQHHQNQHRWSLDFVPVVTSSNSNSSSSSSTTTQSSGGLHRAHANGIIININGNHSHHHNNNNDSGSLQTPTPFYTPNEPSPKFMNSPIFSYSNPDTSLYQGPFSPMRASSLYPPPSSPFTNLSLNSPLGAGSQHSTSSATNNNSSNNNNQNSSSAHQNQNHNGQQQQNCFNMIPSTLLSPAPSQASTNSLSYEDLQEKSLSFFQPVWSIFLAGTKVRFVSGMNSMDWYMVDFLAQSGESLIKGEYAPHGLEVRKFIVTSSAKERIQVTFYAIGDPHHPMIEVNCEPGHPFMVDKKGWCAVKPEVFQEIYGTGCQSLECGDVCLNITSARSPSQYSSQIHHVHQQPHIHHPQVFTSLGSSTSGGGVIKMESIDEKMVPISIVPQQNQNHHMNNSNNNVGNNIIMNTNRKNNCIPPLSPLSITPASSTIVAPASKKSKDNNGTHHKKSNNNNNETKGRRPMNGFLLFAKDKRPELIQMYPGKDNRSISVLLGEAWQSLAPTEREKYSLNAKARAEEQKRIHPDCWKRKRSKSTSSQ